MASFLKTIMGSGATALASAAGLAAFTAWNRKRAEELVPPDGEFADVKGARLHYLDIGEGSPIVLVHGLGGQLRNFTYALSELLAPHHRLIVVDRPGSGYSAYHGDSDRGLAVQGAMIAELMDKLGLHRPLVVGHSLGGAIALAMALAHPGKIGGLALLAPLTQPIETIPQVFKALDLKSPLVRTLLAWTLAVPAGRLGADAANAQVFGPEPFPADFETRGGAALTLRPEAFVAACGDVEAARAEMAGIAARYGELSLPVGIMFAKGDLLLDPSVHGQPTVSAITGAELKLIEGGHMFPLTQPRVTADWIMERAKT
ncbi:alpha/beta fold hydrolase [Novosphingobium sp. NDB2Meth1]|uniref:alpha/beta fold hydrolase n=1 Tax=Novosphingobium sp. NDB2Meth1 TaxID=1892847 RepID=UPI000930C1E2|nr:alpha/beta hydrolase [Novosphingobium sp. NDB2Meth1]